MWSQDEKQLTYKAIAENITLAKLPGQFDDPSDDQKDISDKTVFKNCRPLIGPPLSLILKVGKRRGIQLTERGVKLVRLVSRKDFS